MLCANGHDPEAVLEYSVEKIRLFAFLCARRIGRDQAADDLRLLRILRAANPTPMTREQFAHLRGMEKRLKALAGFEEVTQKSQAAGIQTLIQKMRGGAGKVQTL